VGSARAPEWGVMTVHFSDLPKTYLGKPIIDDSIQGITRLYLDYLQKLVKDAKDTFGA
jgi:hypothetical protein